MIIIRIVYVICYSQEEWALVYRDAVVVVGCSAPGLPEEVIGKGGCPGRGDVFVKGIANLDTLDSTKNITEALDRIDRNILNELQKNGRISNVELSRRVGLSPTPCLDRVRWLEKQKFIQGYVALLNPHLLNASLLVFVQITLDYSIENIFEQFSDVVQKVGEIQECYLATGGFDCLLKIRVADIAAYHKLLKNVIRGLPGNNETRSYVVISEIKKTHSLVVKLI